MYERAANRSRAGVESGSLTVRADVIGAQRVDDDEEDHARGRPCQRGERVGEGERRIGEVAFRAVQTPERRRDQYDQSDQPDGAPAMRFGWRHLGGSINSGNPVHLARRCQSGL
jgi:hypothetical protein